MTDIMGHHENKLTFLHFEFSPGSKNCKQGVMIMINEMN